MSDDVRHSDMRLGVLLAVALLAVTAGCVGGSNGTGRLTVNRVDKLPQGQGAVSYENLSPEQKAAFRQALDEGGTVTIHKGTDRNEFIDPGYVRYDGAIYHTTVSTP